MVHQLQTTGAAEKGVGEGRGKVGVVVALPRQARVIAVQFQAVDFRCHTVEFNRRLRWAFCTDVGTVEVNLS